LEEQSLVEIGRDQHKVISSYAIKDFSNLRTSVNSIGNV
jgi:tRNA threonylcarbamoyladenosine modification (KEOPS) complex  Pcc1 subunit